MAVPPTSDAGGTGEAVGSPPPTGRDPWHGWAAALVDAVLSLPDGDGVTMTAAETDARPVLLRRARLGGFVPARHRLVAPWVRLERAEDHLRGYCVGAESFGGAFPLSAHEDAALLALGWHHPGHGDGELYVRFWPDDVPEGPFLPRDEAQRAVAMVEATFREVLLAAGGDPPTVSN